MRSEWAVLRRGTLAALVVRAFLMASGVATSMLLARMFDRDQLGAYYLFLQTASVGVVCSLFGTTNLIQRFVPQVGGRAVRTVLARAARIALVSFAAFGLLVLLIWPRMVTRMEAPALIPLWAAALAFTLAGAVEEAVSVFFCSIRRVHLGVFLFGLPKQLLFVGLLAITWWGGRGADLSFVIGLRAGTAIAAALLALGLLWRELTHYRGPGSGAPSGRQMTRIATPIAMHLLASSLLSSVDLWCLGLFRGADAVGLYGAMMRLALLLGVLVQAVNAVLPPLLSRLHKHGTRAEVETLVRRAATVGGWGALLLLSLYLVAGKQIVGIVFGPGFTEGVSVLLILAAGQAFYAWTGSAGWLLQMTGHQDLMFRITFWGLVANVALNLLAVRWFGAVGVATVTSLSLAGQNVFRMMYARRLMGVRTDAFLNPARGMAR